MHVHDEVLSAARRLCRERGGWTFKPVEVVRALPHLKQTTVRTHIVSRCCVNAPKHHSDKLDYFRRVGRGTYEIRPAYRVPSGGREQRRPRRDGRPVPTGAVAERGSAYGTRALPPSRDTVHAVVTRDGSWYVAQCLELAVVTQGRTLDELVENLHEAIALHLEGENPGSFGLVGKPRLSVTYEAATRPS